MKLFFIIAYLFFGLSFMHAQVFEVETIKDAGTNDKRLNLVILSEGYQGFEFDKFKEDAESFVAEMFAQSPFLEYSNYFNVHIIKVPSNESGADHPATATDVTEPYHIPVATADTYFNATFDAWGVHRSLYYGLNYADAVEGDLKINAVLVSNFPTYDQALILVNTTEYGGTGGEFPISSTGVSANEIAIHELGHSMFNLKDEYELPEIYYAEAINMTQEPDVNLVKWKNWVNGNGIGVYPYGVSGVSATWYRPHQNCKMRFLGVPFCAVCKEGIVEKIHSIITPIESYVPKNTNLIGLEFPLGFALTLLKPEPNTLERAWTLNTVSFENDVDAVSLLETDLNLGINTLAVVIHDASSFLKVDNHESLHISTVTWTINYTSLGIDVLDSIDNTLNISIYPNPSHTIINLKLESKADIVCRVDLFSMDGKKVKSFSLSHLETHQLDISGLSKGVYITNFYANQVLVASKKIVKY